MCRYSVDKSQPGRIHCLSTLQTSIVNYSRWVYVSNKYLGQEQHRSIGHWSSINHVWVREFRSTPVAIPKEGPTVNFLFISESTPSRALFIHSNCLTSTVGVYSPFGHSFTYRQYGTSVLEIWVDTWTHTGNNHSIGKLHRHHRLTTTKLQVGVLRYEYCIFVGFRVASPYKQSLLVRSNSTLFDIMIFPPQHATTLQAKRAERAESNFKLSSHKRAERAYR